MTSAVVLGGGIKRRLWDLACGRNDGKAPEQSRLVKKAYGERVSNYTGLKGEYVASVVLGVPFDHHVYGAGGDTGVDLWVRGIPCGVKARHLKDGDLMVQSWDDVMPIEVLLLAQGPCERDGACVCTDVEARFDEEEVWRLRGWIWVQDFIAEARERDYGLGWRAVMPWRRLNRRFEEIR